MFKDKVILVTGGTGSWGQELTRHLLRENPREIRIFSRNESAQVMMKRTFDHSRIQFRVGDVRDLEAVMEACRGVDVVFHLAALKHVPVCEMQPDEALKTNVTGTENIIKASIYHEVEKVVDVSTDKAVDPINFYGMSKAFGEKLLIRGNDLGSKTRFVCIRGGNVLGTSGSVVPLFKQCILSGKDLPITSKEMTRFFLTIQEAISLLLRAASVSVGGETFVMKMKTCRIIDLAHVLMKKLGARSATAIKEIGIRPGEKLHEVLVSSNEAPRTYRYSKQYFVILPYTYSSQLLERYSSLPKIDFKQYDSNANFMSHEEIGELLVKSGLLQGE
ncbi:polysaccharide biosynthesis protein [Mechercharimyces sp. CAU 1602]|uniref:polysaccharide biosynthesis protein n=1 Tax=Mechercharimyces sp. CAU 1602 TaxID=2973933 RepID=UPI00216214E3|nr:polysaccharide biosynthesis protein [Mechercharimyces sp. CAU 1602]MCS1350159.1 polysaccharide biosynthesis protein [Mechercharimyces sp. CAU 1602]